MRGRIIDHGTERHDSAWVERAVTFVRVPLDVLEIHSPGDARPLIEATSICSQVRIIDEAAQVALEMSDINCIEPDQRREQTPVRLRELIAGEETAHRESLLEPVESLEERSDSFLIGRLRRDTPWPGGGVAPTLAAWHAVCLRHSCAFLVSPG